MSNVTPEPRGYGITSAELRRLADALDSLPPRDKPLYVHASLLPDEKTAEAVDAIAEAIGAKPGKTERDGDGKWRRNASLILIDKKFFVGVQATVPGPPDERDAEIERLKAELDAARAGYQTTAPMLQGAVDDPTGTGFSREDLDVGEPDTAVPAGVTTSAYPVRGPATAVTS